MLKTYQKRIIKLSIQLFILIFAIFYIYFRPIFLLKVIGESMIPSLQPGQIVLANKFDKVYTIGDVVLVEQNSELIIKRIAYVGGQRIPVVDLGVRKYQTLPIMEDLDNHIIHLQKCGIKAGYYTIPNNYVFLLGDNLSVSEDSRMFGAVPISTIKGKIIEF